MIPLSEDQKIALASLSGYPGYRTLRDAMELLCKDENGRLLSIDRSNGATAEQVLAAQDQTRSYFRAFEQLQDVVDRCAEEREAAGEEPGEGKEREKQEHEPGEDFVLDQDQRDAVRGADGDRNR